MGLRLTMKVPLSHGYFLAEDAKERELMRPYPPLGILYLAAYLEQSGFPPRCLIPPFRRAGCSDTCWRCGPTSWGFTRI